MQKTCSTALTISKNSIPFQQSCIVQSISHFQSAKPLLAVPSRIHQPQWSSAVPADWLGNSQYRDSFSYSWSLNKNPRLKDMKHPELPAPVLPIALPSTRRSLQDLTTESMNRRTIQLCAHQQVQTQETEKLIFFHDSVKTCPL